MHKTLAICALLFLATFATGQIVNSAGQPVTGPLMGLPVLTGPTIFFPYPAGGVVLQSGYATTAGWGYPPLLSTPTASFSTLSASPVGATNATSNLQVGASNSTVESVTAPIPAVQTGIEITQPGAFALESVPTQFAPQTQEVAAGSAGAGLGAAYFDVVNARAPGDVRSLGEVVRERRQQPKTAAARTFTNADLQNLKDRDKPASQSPR
jgi:hypothetical protein